MKIVIDIRRVNAYNKKRSVGLLGVITMEYITIKEAASRWNLSVRRVQTMCSDGMIQGVIKFGNSWAIPEDAERPKDHRIKSGKYIKECRATSK